MNSAHEALSEREYALLDFEGNWPAHIGCKAEAIRDCFDITAARYYQLLHRLLDKPAALAYDPLTVKRLRRRRDERDRRRAGRALGERPGQ
ncbi:MAG TPA: DUF3263 domain-containing protein [Egibacteraceae bacterium]|nr:DUF3263 domain-containing protein [Egibacteraceae bacterium]